MQSGYDDPYEYFDGSLRTNYKVLGFIPYDEYESRLIEPLVGEAYDAEGNLIGNDPLSPRRRSVVEHRARLMHKYMKTKDIKVLDEWYEFEKDLREMK